MSAGKAHRTASPSKAMMTEEVDKVKGKIQSLIDNKKRLINACSDNLKQIARELAMYEIKLVHGTVTRAETATTETRETRKEVLARDLDNHTLDLVTLERVKNFLMRGDFRQAFALGKSTDRPPREEHLVEIYDAIKSRVEACSTET